MAKEQNIELAADEPPITKIIDELERAQTDANPFYRRMEQARRYWQAHWHGISCDGRKHTELYGEDVFPWEGAADNRVRSVATLIRDHVTVTKYAFFKAKVQARSMRPLVQGRESNKATKLLQWRLYNHMWPELLREVPFLLNWKFGYGVALLSVQWEQARRLEYKTITVADLADILGFMGGNRDQAQRPEGNDPSLLNLQSAFTDPDQEDALTTLIQELSPIVSRPQARKIVADLRQLRFAKIPVAYPYVNKPRWRALRPTIDCIFPSETSDLQEGRFYAESEWVSETELEDRIETENYDPEFVEVAKKQKGEAGLELQLEGPNRQPRGSYRDLIQIYAFYYKAIMEGAPCLLKTVFHPLSARNRAGKPLYATHGLAEYDHGLYPAVVFRRTFQDRRILHSVGIAEEAYTYEQSIKAQLDGLTDRTSLIHRPPMIVPQNKVGVYQNNLRPGAILGSNRPKEVTWPPLPPTDGTPVQVIELVTKLMHEMYPLFGADLDPNQKQLYQQEVADDCLGGFTLAIEQTWQLMQQYEADAEVAEVVGPLARPFHVDRSEIQGKHEISAVINMRMLDNEYVSTKLDWLAKAMSFKQEGLLFNMAIETIDPDAADAIKQDQMSPAAMEKEKQDERNAIAQAFAGMEAPMPIHGNHQLRLQTIQEVFQNNPMMMQRVQMLPDTQKILQNRMKFFQNQIQQYTQNPQIGRALATRTFQRGMAPEVQQAT